MHIENKESLQKIINDYKNNESIQDKFNKVISGLQDSGFRPLNPIFKSGDSKSVEDFLKRKIQRNKRDKINLSNSRRSSVTERSSVIDLNFKIKWSSDYKNVGDYLKGVL